MGRLPLHSHRVQPLPSRTASCPHLQALQPHSAGAARDGAPDVDQCGSGSAARACHAHLHPHPEFRVSFDAMLAATAPPACCRCCCNGAAGLLPLLLQRRRRPAATATAHPPPAPPQQVPWRRARHRLLFAAGHAAGGGLGAMVRAAPPRVELASWSHLPGTLRGLSCAAGGQGCPAHRQERELLGMLCWLARRLGSKAAHACAAAATPAAPRLLCT